MITLYLMLAVSCGVKVNINEFELNIAEPNKSQFRCLVNKVTCVEQNPKYLTDFELLFLCQ